MPKAKEKTVVPDEEEETALHGTVNPEEARKHTLNLDKAMDKIEQGNQKPAQQKNVMKKCYRKKSKLPW